MKMRRLVAGFLAGLWFTLPHASVGAQTEPSSSATPAPAASPAAAPEAPTQTAAPAESVAPDWQFNGFVGSSYSWNLNRPSDGINLLHGYDEFAGKLRLDVIDLNLQYRLDQPNHTGFRLDITGGLSMPRIDAASGLFRDPYTGYSATNFDIRQMFVSHTFDNGLRVDGGKFATHIGYEVMDGVDGRNPNATRALTFTYSPFTHTGLKVSYPVTEQLSIMGLATLGADNWQDTNRSLSWGGQINYHPTDRFSLVFNIFDGPEQIRNDRDRRQLVELIASYKVHDQVTLAMEAMTAREDGIQGGTGNWNSLVLYLMTDITDRFSLNLRQEWFNDPQGAHLPVAARISGFTITPEYKITKDWIVRMDFRFDRADQPIYNSQSQLIPHQNTIFLGQSLRF